jgi:micrococcal nuclease
LKTIRLLSRSAFAVGFLVLLLANTVLGQQPVIHGRVVAVTDGDTLKVLVAGQQLLRIWLAFCDAPEKKQAFGARAKQAMSELVFDKDIELRTHAIDRYGRTVARVAVDGKDVGEEMLRQGMAWIYNRYITEAPTEIQDTYRKAQEEAKADKRGLWSDPNAIPPWLFRDLAKAHQGQTIASKWIEGHQKSADPNKSSSELASPSPSASPVNSDDVCAKWAHPIRLHISINQTHAREVRTDNEGCLSRSTASDLASIGDSVQPIFLVLVEGCTGSGSMASMVIFRILFPRYDASEFTDCKFRLGRK